jgi:exodeoxyribonuclease VII large subunit
VTSAGAAALRDILTILQRRNPLVSVLIAPALVQGELAPPQIVRALRWLDDRDDIDLIIIARGGGSIEDLWAFNDERVARAVFTARHPIISGVGHETDFTITDFVADLRAPTPSAAAELAVPDLSGSPAAIQYLAGRLTEVIEADITQRREALRVRVQLLSLLSPRRAIDADLQRIDGLIDRLARAMRRNLDRQMSRLAIPKASLSAVNPMATLARGFAIVRDADGQLIRSIHEARSGERIIVQVSDGTFGARVSE